MSTPQHKYERDFLTLVILRVDFPDNPLTLTTEPSEFTRAIADRFPHTSAHPIRDVTFSLTEGGADLQQADRGVHWVHRHSVDGTVAVTLQPTFLSIEFGPADYQGYTGLRQLVEYLLHHLQQIGVRQFSRIGLRYVNEIRLPGRATDWDDVIDQKILAAVFARPLANGRIQRSMHQICELHDDDQVILNYGLVNPDYPAPLIQRHFVLDVDCSREGVITILEGLESIESLNDLATRVFESCIGDKLRQIMGVRND